MNKIHHISTGDYVERLQSKFYQDEMFDRSKHHCKIGIAKCIVKVQTYHPISNG